MDLLKRAAVALLAPAMLAAPAGGAEIAEEYSLKAAFLLNFTKFIEWPEEAFHTHDQPLGICILGHDPFGEVADLILAGETAGGRRLELRRIEAPEEAGTCHVVFLSAAEEPARIRQMPAAQVPFQLTVGETEEFLQHGGLLRFHLREDRLRLVINGATLDRSRLKISSKLLRLTEVRKQQELR